VTAAAIVEEPLVPTPDEQLPPITLTGDDETDEALAMLRSTTQAIHDAQDRVAELSDERKRLVLTLRRRRVLFRQIANAAGSTDQTIYKIHREAVQDERDRADTVTAESLGYPSLDAYRQARADAVDAGGIGDVPPYTPPELTVVENDDEDDAGDRQVPHPDEP
jgi:hypothetical protein